jgi:peptidyl-prolyl cis-trans isomerase B (cyclophilin B)
VTSSDQPPPQDPNQPPAAGQPPQYPPPAPYGQPQYGQPQYGQPYGGAPMAQGTNGLAIASLICAFLCSPLGLIFGFIAKSQIRSRGGGGDGLATAGIILSAIFLVLGIILAATGNASFHASTN